MAEIWAWSGGSNTSPYDTQAKAAPTLTAAITYFNTSGAAGDQICAPSTYSNNAGGAITIAPNKHCSILSLDASGNISAGAKDFTGGSNIFALSPTAAAEVDIWGWTFQAGADAGTGSFAAVLRVATPQSVNYGQITFNYCNLVSTCTTGASSIQLGSSASSTTNAAPISMYDTTLTLADGLTTVPGVSIGSADVRIYRPTIAYSVGGANKAKLLFGPLANQLASVGSLYVTGDLSAFDSSATSYLFGVGGNLKIVAENIVKHSNPAMTNAAWVDSFASVTCLNVDVAGNAHNTFEYHDRKGSITENASVYTNDANAVQYDGAGLGLTLVTNAIVLECAPFRTPWISFYNTSTSAQKISIPFTHSAAAELTDRDIFIEVMYPSAAGSPVWSRATDRNANPYRGTPANQASTSATFASAGTYTQECGTTITAGAAGLISVRLTVAMDTAVTVTYEPGARVDDVALDRAVWAYGNAFNQPDAGGGSTNRPSADRIMAGF